MGASRSNGTGPAARQMAASGKDKSFESLARRGQDASQAPQGVTPGLASENVLNPSVGVPGSGRQGEAFANLLSRRRRQP